VHDVADVGAQKHEREVAEDLGALIGDDPGHHRKNADGAEGNDEGHHAVNDAIEGADKVLRELALFTSSKDAAAEHQRDHDNLQHVRVGKGLPHVAREDSDQRIHEIRARRAVPGLTVRQGKVRRKEAGVQEDVGKHQADDAGRGRGDEEVGDRLPADGADLLHVAHGDDAVDHRQQHDGHDDELEEVNEDGTKGFEIVRRDLGLTDKVEDKTDHDAQDQCKNDLHRQAHFFLFHTTHTLFLKSLPFIGVINRRYGYFTSSKQSWQVLCRKNFVLPPAFLHKNDGYLSCKLVKIPACNLACFRVFLVRRQQTNRRNDP